MKMFAISEPQLVAVLEYLAQRPYREVADAIMTLRTLPEASIPAKEDKDVDSSVG